MTRRRRGRPVNPPIERASTLLVDDAAALYDPDIETYGRGGLAVHDALREAFVTLEGAAACTLAPSGLSAMTTAILALAQGGAHVLVTDCAYAPVRAFCRRVLPQFGISTEFYPPRIGGEIAARLRPETALVVLESPGSLTFEVQDTPAIARVSAAAGVTTLVDATWTAGIAQRPLALGVDVAVHAATKFASGGSDVFLGAILSREAEHGARIARFARACGLAVSPDDAAQVLRGLRSLPLRYTAQDRTARALARWLEGREEVAQVIHPALESHPDHALWLRDFTAAAGVFAFVPAATDDGAAARFLDALKVFGLGFSYGGFESLAVHAAPQIKGREQPPALSGPLVRLAIGLEPEDALRADLEAGLEAAAGDPGRT